jgi:hypothetical protein
MEISSSGFEGALYLLHIEQRALHLYVTMTVPFNFFSAIHQKQLSNVAKRVSEIRHFANVHKKKRDCKRITVSKH